MFLYDIKSYQQISTLPKHIPSDINLKIMFPGSHTNNLQISNIPRRIISILTESKTKDQKLEIPHHNAE